jgi:hypothetical protein
MRRVTELLAGLWLVATLLGCRERVSLTESLLETVERATVLAETDRSTAGGVADAARRERLWDQARERGWNIGGPLEESDEVAAEEQRVDERPPAPELADERVPVAGLVPDPIEPEAPVGTEVPDGTASEPLLESSELGPPPGYDLGSETSEPEIESGSEPGVDSGAGGADADELGAGGAATGGAGPTGGGGPAGGAGPEANLDSDALLDDQEAWELAWQDRWDEQQALAAQAWEETQLLAQELAATNATLSELQAEHERLRQEAEIAALLAFFNAQRLLAVQQGLMLMSVQTSGPSTQSGEPSR